MAKPYDLRSRDKSRLIISKGKVCLKEDVNEKINSKIALDYGLRTPKHNQVNLNKELRVKLKKLDDECLNHMIKTGHTSSLPDASRELDISVKMQHPYSFRIALIILIVIIGAIFVLLFFNCKQDFLRQYHNLKPAYDLMVLPVKNFNKMTVQTDMQLKPRKQEIKRTLFIEQECRNFQANDLQYDYASESNGARILSTFNTEHFSESLINFKFLGLSLGPVPSILLPQNFFGSNGPSSLLERFIKVKNCWAFKGTTGRVRIALSQQIYIKKIIVEDYSSLGIENSAADSSPRYFSITGIDYLDNGQEIKHYLGQYEFERDGGKSQIFFVTPGESALRYSIIDFQVTANHGNKDFTCVYRLKVYGSI